MDGEKILESLKDLTIVDVIDIRLYGDDVREFTLKLSDGRKIMFSGKPEDYNQVSFDIEEF